MAYLGPKPADGPKSAGDVTYAPTGDIASITVQAALTEIDDERPPLRGYIDGFILSNNLSDANNDIDISVGLCRSDDDTHYLRLSSALTKRLDAAWVVGNGNGGLDTGSKAISTWYHVWAIKRIDTSVVDVLFSTSATSPTMPANYTAKRRLGSVQTNGSGNIIAFYQVGDRFDRTPITVYNSTSNGSLVPLTLAVPTGVSVIPLLISIMQQATDGDAVTYVSSVSSPVSPYAINASNDAPGRNIVTVVGPPTDVNGQIKYVTTLSSGTLSSCTLQTYGWIDPRGKQ